MRDHVTSLSLQVMTSEATYNIHSEVCDSSLHVYIYCVRCKLSAVNIHTLVQTSFSSEKA